MCLYMELVLTQYLIPFMLLDCREYLVNPNTESLDKTGLVQKGEAGFDLILHFVQVHV